LRQMIQKATSMKFGCRVCGAHFKDEFEKTIVSPCMWWQDIGLSSLSKKHKKRLWKNLSDIPYDEIAGEYNIALAVTVVGHPLQKVLNFEEFVPGYNEMTEEERKEYQRKYFKTLNEIETKNLQIKKGSKPTLLN